MYNEKTNLKLFLKIVIQNILFDIIEMLGKRKTCVSFVTGFKYCCIIFYAIETTFRGTFLIFQQCMLYMNQILVFVLCLTPITEIQFCSNKNLSIFNIIYSITLPSIYYVYSSSVQNNIVYINVTPFYKFPIKFKSDDRPEENL